ncbi:kinase-like protein [Cylindrobasidium torrendii FP15055 ss-10]|uniref:Kinase-like protein n=1 Tax=Cylindrobasidium torrendii FP15055 ss-10 TaxID=1314674 RepID=A0A0D7B9D5_9AGAR|nr:kinase-like protein [Cylindrobasidium torrendii FP15055 ss-10]
MEYFHGCELLVWKCNFLVIPNALLRHVAREVLLGLDFLHIRAGLVHRDLNMRNIMMDASYRVKIIDLGSATSDTHPDDEDGLEIGFTAFTDPDIRRINMIIPACDIWSLGMVIMHLNSNGYRYPCSGAAAVDQWTSISKRSLRLLGMMTGEKGQFLQACLVDDSTVRPSAAMLLQLDWVHTLSVVRRS